jgi:hypothetical protein
VFLASVLKHVDPGLGIQIACSQIVETEHPIVAWASARLFNPCVKKLGEPPALDVSDIFPKFIESLAAFSDSQIPHAIQTMSGGLGGHLEDLATDLVGALLELVESQVPADDEESKLEGAGALLQLIANLVKQLEDGSPALLEICEAALPRIVELVGAFPNMSSLNQALQVIAAINAKIKEPSPVQFQALVDLLSQDNEDLLSAAQEFAGIICPLVSGIDAALLPAVVQLAESMFRFALESDEVVESDCNLEYSLILAACLLSHIGDAAPFMPFCLQAMDKLAEEFDKLLFDAICQFIAVAFLANADLAAAALLEPVLQLVVNLLNAENLQATRDLVAGFVILVNVAQRCSDLDALVRACELLPKLAGDDDGKEAEEADGEEEEEEEIDDEGELDIPYKIPVDAVDPLRVIAPLATDLPQEIRDQVRQLIAKHTAPTQAE